MQNLRYLIHWPIAFAPNKGNFPKKEDGSPEWDTPVLNPKEVWGVMEEFQKV